MDVRPYACLWQVLTASAWAEPHSHGDSHDEKDAKHGHGRLLSAISEDSSVSTTSTYGCPVCRKAHILDLDRLQV